MHGKVTERNFAQVVSQRTRAKQKVVQEKLCMRASDATLLDARNTVADKSSLVLNGCQLLDTFLKNPCEVFFIPTLHHVCGAGSMFRASMSKHFDVIGTTGRSRHGNIC